MKIIQELADMIEEEISDAYKYARCSIRHKDDDPDLSKAFAQLSTEELGHADKLHLQIVRLINAYKAEHGEPPEHMKIIYKIMHARMMDNVASVKAMLA